MIELKPVDFNKIEKHIGMKGLTPEPESVILGYNPGRIFTDQSDAPKTALIWSQGIEGFYLIGDETNTTFLLELNTFIDETISPMLMRLGYDYFEVSGSHDRWQSAIQQTFENRKIDTWTQITHEWDPHIKIKKCSAPATYNIRSIKDMKGHKDLTNIDYLYDALRLYWGSIEKLIEFGNCYYAEKDKHVIGFCCTGFCTQHKKALNIETDESFRRKGIAYNLAIHSIREILEEGYIPYWDCMEENSASKKLAEKLQFKNTGTYTCFGFSLTDEPMSADKERSQNEKIN